MLPWLSSSSRLPCLDQPNEAAMTTRAARLRRLLAEDRCHMVPSCWDALSARMIEQAGFPMTFMSGFAVSAARLGQPDLGLISYAEMADQLRNICAVTQIPVIGDGDTGWGNALNVERTVHGFFQAGAASVMIEDQVSPKRCGHTKGKLVVERAEALDRIKAAVYARDQIRRQGGDILVLARTDARAGHGLDEAVWRANAFRDLGADILFVEAPHAAAEMERMIKAAPGIHLANMVEGGATPILPMPQLRDLGYGLAIFPLTLLSAAMRSIKDNLAVMKAGGHPAAAVMDFAELRAEVGFEAYYAAEQRYAGKREG
jgi:2-methylisocitrate lyase-like PEP mutase family enzyme